MFFQCQFAHGRRELRDVVRNNKYKTKLCQKYWVAGYCAYGPRCNFLHDEDKMMSEIAVKEVSFEVLIKIFKALLEWFTSLTFLMFGLKIDFLCCRWTRQTAMPVSSVKKILFWQNFLS